jgi:EAL domain-containing protein (putative c-di-GMP-specific phosphodiesterase class I)
VQLGHELGMKVVAEGIETVASWNRLRDMGCDIGQGHAFAAALDAPNLNVWIDQWRTRNEDSGLRPVTASCGERKRT